MTKPNFQKLQFFRTWLLFACVFFIHTAANAQQKPQPIGKENQTEKLVSPREISQIRKEKTRTENASGRENSSFKIALNAFSLIPYPGFGANIGYFLTDNVLIEAEANASYFNDGTPLDPSSSASIIQLHGRFFFPASFYVALGGGYQTTLTKTVFDSDPRTPDEEVYTSTLFDTMGATAAVGSEWHFGVWSVGAEYLGLYLPFVVIYKGFNQKGLRNSEELDERVRFRNAKPNIVPTLLKLKLGLNF